MVQLPLLLGSVATAVGSVAMLLGSVASAAWFSCQHGLVAAVAALWCHCLFVTAISYGQFIKVHYRVRAGFVIASLGTEDLIEL